MKYFKDLLNKVIEILSSNTKQEPKIERYFRNPTCPQPKQHFDGVCIESCGYSFFCDECGLIDNCTWVQKVDFDKNKQSILLIDDNPGVVSFLRDDIEAILKKHSLDYNIIEFTGINAVYKFLATLQHYNSLNITKAVIDITYGGSVQTNNGSIRLNGVDVFKALIEKFPELQFCFYTGNQLNPYIKRNKATMDYFKNIYYENILEHVLYKTSMNMDSRIAYFEQKLFNL